MESQNLFSEKNKKNVSMYHLLKILPRVLSIKFSILMVKISSKKLLMCNFTVKVITFIIIKIKC